MKISGVAHILSLLSTTAVAFRYCKFFKVIIKSKVTSDQIPLLPQDSAEYENFLVSTK